MGGKVRLPDAFESRMRRLLGSEYEAFGRSYEQDRYYGLRYNPLKATEEEFLERMPFVLDKISWAKEGFYYRAEEQPGRHVLHEAGAYYIQEPSAMAVVEALDPEPEEMILDLCAAPGGKSTQIAGRMQGRGLLVSNEIIPNRAKILAQNIERMGIRNCVVCNETPERMAVFFPAFFDKIVVDAPCSGEGMFRKDETAILEWNSDQVRMCAERQLGILEQAAGMLKPGGRLVYSTCTFAPEENEGVISRFLKTHMDFVIEKTPCGRFFEGGRPDWIEDPAAGLENTMRLFPHKIKGEGHYIAVLRRQGTLLPGTQESQNRKEAFTLRAEGSHKKKATTGKAGRRGATGSGRADDRTEDMAADFLHTQLGLPEDWIDGQGGNIQLFGEQIYLAPEQMISMQGMKVVRPGLHLAADKKNRLEPSHALALALQPWETGQNRELTLEETRRYLHGETLTCGEEKGWLLLTYLGYPVGFGKASGGQIKNHYPKGLRK
ncbi:MAG: RsmF rRNA methyltransferase first C-terminal domain-containing protein [Lachnospiraceae bacterium]|nr:RsmF rRNA methyltransferase first C-terminal domain-containing protein [Lachnospiraceae bacterium]